MARQPEPPPKIKRRKKYVPPEPETATSSKMAKSQKNSRRLKKGRM